MSTAAEKYKNTLEAATRVGAKGYVPVATNVPYTPQELSYSKVD